MKWLRIAALSFASLLLLIQLQARAQLGSDDA